MNAAYNVVRMNQDTTFKYIQSFLRNKGTKSKNTELAYLKDLQQFFKFMRNKDIEDLTEQDLLFKHVDMIDYQTHLHENHSAATIKRKIMSVISLYKFLKKNGINVDPDILRVDNDYADDSEHAGFLSVEEVNQMINLAEENELKMFILLAFITSLRKDAILTLKWNQITPSFDDKEYYIISTIDKGKRRNVEIHKDQYEQLNVLRNDSENLFTLNGRQIEYRFQKLIEKIGIPEERNITIHSLKRAGVNTVKDMTGDIHAAQAQAGHSSPQVTDKWYLDKPKNSLARLLANKDESVLDQLTYEELLQMVKGMNGGVKYTLIAEAQKIVDARK